MRKTKQKLLIKEEINRFNKLFTAEELLSRVKKTNKKISIATIYRFLKDLREKKELHSYLCDRNIIRIGKNNNNTSLCEAMLWRLKPAFWQNADNKWEISHILCRD